MHIHSVHVKSQENRVGLMYSQNRLEGLVEWHKEQCWASVPMCETLAAKGVLAGSTKEETVWGQKITALKL